jgi:hypothetical protein
MRKIDYDCGLYGWTEDDIFLNEKTSGHIRHYINNDLCILFLLIKSLKDRLDCKENADDIVKKIESTLELLHAYVKEVTDRTK